MASIPASAPKDTSRIVQSAPPIGGLRFDWQFIFLALLFVVGLFVDGWAHNHGRVDDSFFTPWHFIFYSGFGLVALFLGVTQYRNVGRGHAWGAALPQGYMLSLIGAILFAVGGVGDLIWHTLFGIEAGSEALLSPSHITLAVGMALVITGPLRAAWLRRDLPSGWQAEWAALFPALISATLLLTLLTFFTFYSNPLTFPAASRMMRGGDMLQDYGVTALFLSAVFLGGVVLTVARRWKLPFGAITVMFGVNTLFMTVLSDTFSFIPAALIAGLLVDLLAQRLKPWSAQGARYSLFAFLLPVLYYALYMATIVLFGGMRWSIHVWTGAIFIVGIIGVLIGLLQTSAVRTDPASA